MSTLPPFETLPLRKDGPRGNAWGLFGEDDQNGMLNLLTSDNTVQASREIIDGTRVSTDWTLTSMSPPSFGRRPFEHTIKHLAPLIVDDEISFNTQSSSQWDGFRHFGFQKEEKFYNGKTRQDLETTTLNGIQAWVDRGGIVGRGVLLDYVTWAETNGHEVKPFEPASIDVEALNAVAASQGTEFKKGDILFIRSGWNRAYKALSEEGRQALADQGRDPLQAQSIGIEPSEKTLRWLWDHSFAAIAGDQPSMEVWPPASEEFFLHEWLLAGWGLPIGELFDLEQLSEECKKKNRYAFFFSSMPLKIPGGVASPPNGVAVF